MANHTNLTGEIVNGMGSAPQGVFLNAGLLFLGFLVVAFIIRWVLKRYGQKIWDAPGNDALGEILKIIHKPVYWILLVTGFLLAVKMLPLGDTIELWTNRTMFMFHAIMLAHLLSRASSVIVGSWIKVTKKYEKTPELVNKIIAIVIYIIAILVILDYFEVQITPMIATLGVGGIAVGLALQDTLKDLFAGLHIISDQPIKVGDYVELEGAANLQGYVNDIGWRSTRIKTLLGNYVIVPNSTLARSTILNNSMYDSSMLILLEVGVDYGSDLEEVEKITHKVAKKVQKTVEGAVPDHDPGIRFYQFADSNVNLRVVLKVGQITDKFAVRSEFMKMLHSEYKKKGIEISWPIRKMYHMNNPSENEEKEGKKK